MTTLTDFLLTRIAEDEEVAREAEWREPYGAWEYAIVNQSGRIQSSIPTGDSGGWVEHLAITHDSEGLSDSVSDNAGPHIARHDPARVLAECEAKRRIVRLYSAQHDEMLFCLLALPYADHPDYRQEWKP